MANFAAIWMPVTKTGAYPAHYFRSKHVSRASKRVKDVNAKFISVAAGCKGNHTSDKSFQMCMRKGMTGFKAPGTDAPSYVYAKSLRGVK